VTPYRPTTIRDLRKPLPMLTTPWWYWPLWLTWGLVGGTLLLLILAGMTLGVIYLDSWLRSLR
jgi:hypothetical protein